MIVKQLDKPISDDKYSQVGHEAEKQMAYYLKHQYSDSDDIFIFNNIRFKWLDDYTQIDHLILHEYGMIIVESKSVTSKVRFNDRREWNRWWDNKWGAMSNPVEQAKRQATSLKKTLNHNREKMLRKILGKTLHSFDKMPIDCVVAISDKCVEIIRPKKNDYSNVIKADLVTEHINNIIAKYKKEDGPLSLKVPWMLSKGSMTRIKDFILNIHDPVTIKEVNKKTVPDFSDDRFKPKPTEQEKIQTYTRCDKCKGKLSILWGAKYKNHYWHCNDCGKNISIDDKCPECREKLRIRKQKNDYFIYCEPCQLEVLYHSVDINE